MSNEDRSIELARQYAHLDLPTILLEYRDFALNGSIPGVTSPHYALAGMFEWTAGEVGRLRKELAALKEGEA